MIKYYAIESPTPVKAELLEHVLRGSANVVDFKVQEVSREPITALSLAIGADRTELLSLIHEPSVVTAEEIRGIGDSHIALKGIIKQKNERLEAITKLCQQLRLQLVEARSAIAAALMVRNEIMENSNAGD